MRVPRLRPDPLPDKRFDRYKVGLEIRSCIQARGRGYHARVAEHLGMEPQNLSHRLSGRYKVEIDFVGAIAEFMDAPSGWPLIPWHIARGAFGDGSPLRR